MGHEEKNRRPAEESQAVLLSLFSNYITKAELASAADVSDRTIDRWERSGIGPPRISIGGRIFYNRQTVFAWIAAKEQEAQKPR
jgi:phage terminase Nu1 subunit (DNA packaging protein)